MKKIKILTFVFAFASMYYQLSLAQLMGSIFGGLSIQYIISTGLFIFTLGLGSLIYEKKMILNLLYIELLLIFFGVVISYILVHISAPYYCFLINISLVGLCSGMEIPALMKEVGDEFNSDIWSIDLIASGMAIVCFILKITLQINILQIIYTTGIINLLGIIGLLIYKKKYRME